MSVSKLIEEAFNESSMRKSDFLRKWIDASFLLGSRLPNSILPVSIQRSGKLDILLRCMEDENKSQSLLSEGSASNFSVEYLVMLSEVWVGQVYEILRLLIERKLEPQPGLFAEISHELRLLRITIEKHEIAADRKLTSPVQMIKTPQKNDDTDFYTYSKDDPIRSHIMPVSISPQGSVAWNVIDIPNNKTYWIERRILSDRILELCKK